MGKQKASGQTPTTSTPSEERPTQSAAAPLEQPDAAKNKYSERFDLLIQSGRDLSSTFDPDVIYERLYNSVSQAMDCATFVLSLYTPEDNLIRCVHARMDGDLLDTAVFPPLPMQWDNPNATQGRAIATGKSIVIDDYAAHISTPSVAYYVDSDSEVYEDDGDDEEVTRSGLIVPMILDNQVVGVVQVQSYRVSAFSQDDLHFLEALAPQVAIVLQNSTLHQQLQAHAVELEARVEQRTAQLQHALDNEKQLAELKARFVSLITHEFRNPLAAIQTSIDLVNLYANRMTDAQRDQHLHQIQAQIDHLGDLVDEVLFISRAETIGLQPQLETIRPLELCQKIVSVMQLTTPTHLLILNVAGGEQPLELDAKLLQQALGNLIANAVKYSPNSTTVNISLTTTAEELRIAIRDSGIGIAEADLEHLFNAFFRGSNVGEISGTGLGLVIAKRAIEAHKGQLEVESRLGVGTTFTIRIPVRTAT